MRPFSDLAEMIRSQIDRKFPLAVFCRPSGTSVESYFQQSERIFNCPELMMSGFIARGFSGEAAFCIPQIESGLANFELPKEFISNNGGSKIQQADENEEQRFKELVRLAVAGIDRGQFQKVVISRAQKLIIPEIDIIRSFGNLMQYEHAFRYLLYLPGTGFWMGATPEQLLQLRENSLSTVALAGTRLFSDEGSEWGEKEIYEQQIVTNYIMKELQPSSSSVAAGKPYTVRAGAIEHIKTDITAELLDNITLAEATSALHPTPAVCGYPKQPALDFIEANEGYDRELYSGFIGVVETNSSDLYVNLRCMKAEGNEVTVYVGCGITAESDPDKEYLETVHKAETIIKVL